MRLVPASETQVQKDLASCEINFGILATKNTCAWS